MKVVIAGGGTAGHVYPGIAIADELSLEVPDAEIVFVGGRNGLEAELVHEAGYVFEPIEAKGFKRSVSLSNISAFFQAIKSSSHLRNFFKKFKPEVVVGTGGYVSAPAIFAAYNLKIPTLIHEQNAYPGLANKVLSRLVETVATSFPNGEESFPKAKRVVFTGNPIRRKIIGAVKDSAIKKLTLDEGKKTLLIFGGSQGAKKINDCLIDGYDKFKTFDNLQIIHITGKEHFDDVCKRMKPLIDVKKDKLRYQAHPYISNINQAYAASDLCVCRAGATTIAELTALGVPAVLIPYPYATGNHQEKNARFLENHGAGKVILDNELTADALFNVCNQLVFDSKTLVEMKNHAQKLGKPYAANDLAKLISGISHKLRI